MIKQTFRVLKMYCPTCPMRIEGLLEDLPGIQRVRVSYHKEQMVVEYDQTLVTVETMRSALEKEGYGLELKAVSS